MSPQGRAVGEIPADKAMVNGFMTTATANQEGDLVVRNVRFDNRPGTYLFAFTVVSLDQTVEQFVGNFERIVDEFFQRHDYGFLIRAAMVTPEGDSASIY